MPSSSPNLGGAKQAYVFLQVIGGCSVFHYLMTEFAS